MPKTTPVLRPDLSSRPFQLTVERDMAAPPQVLFKAWTVQFDQWFAAPGALWMRPEVNVPFFFEVQHQGQRHPHYGRFLTLEPVRRVELTWLTGAKGTQGAETVVAVDLAPRGAGTHLTLTHTGFYDKESRDHHEQAWPQVLAHLDESFPSAKGN